MNKKASITPQRSTKEDVEEKNRRQLDDCYRIVGGRDQDRICLRPDQIISKGQALIEWLEKETWASDVNEWLNKEKIPDRRWREWVAKYPQLKEDYEDALRILAARRGRWLINEKDEKKEKYLLNFHGHYNPEYRKYMREEQAYQASLKAENEDKTQGPINIYFKDFTKIPDKK
jgi:hypothetical protein